MTAGDTVGTVDGGEGCFVKSFDGVDVAARTRTLRANIALFSPLFHSFFFFQDRFKLQLKETRKRKGKTPLPDVRDY